MTIRPAYRHSVGMLLSTYARWLDGAHNALEMRRLEAALQRNSSPNLSQERRHRMQPDESNSRGTRPIARVK